MSAQAIRCGGCQKERLPIRFSKTAINKFKQSERLARSRNDDSLIRLPRCGDCNAGPVQELQCARCGLFRGLDGFSRAQRKNHDNALCIDCSQERQDIEPRHVDQVQEEQLMDGIRTGVLTSDIMSGSTALGHNAHSRNDPHASTNIDGASDWMPPPVPIPDDPRAASPRASYPKAPSISGASNNTHMSKASGNSNGGWSNFAQTDASYRGRESVYSGSSGAAPGRNSGFAKQGAVKADPYLKAQGAVIREQNSLQTREEQAYRHESDDDDNSDDEDPY